MQNVEKREAMAFQARQHVGDDLTDSFIPPPEFLLLWCEVAES